MDNKKNGIPKLRFPGFTGAWEQRKLGEVATFSKGTGYSKQDLENDGTPIILYGRMYTNYELVIHSVNTFTTAKEKSIYSNGGEVIVPASGETAEDISVASVVEQANVLLGGDLNIIHTNKNVEPVFLALSITNGEPHKDMAKRAQGKSVVHLHNSDLAQIKLSYPSKDEQKKIDSYFLKFDSLIALHQRKLKHLQEQKKGLLQKMFPKNGETVPEVRFPGFTDAWEQRKLGEVATFINGRAYKQNELLDSGKYKVLRVGNFYTNDSWYYSNLELADKYYIDEGDLVYTWSATFGPHIWNGEKVIYHYHIWKIELSKFLDRDFTLQILEADKAKLLANTNGSTMIHVTKKDMESKVISLPNIEEQKKIGSYLMKFDSLITLHQRKLDHLELMKKGLLQQMFV